MTETRCEPSADAGETRVDLRVRTAVGWFGGLPKRAWRWIQQRYRHAFCNNNYVFRHDGPFPPEVRSDCVFMSFDSPDDVPENVWDDMRRDGKPTRLGKDRRELDENATLWVAVVDGHVASTVFTRRGRFFRRWFVSLEPDDTVVFRLRTHPDFRGRGFAPSLMRHCLHQSMAKSQRAFIDCRTYNRPSIACIEKAGFFRIATMKTLSRAEALYGRT
jgi:ribosomal protein S18 acetylase RimI-like enzyme